MSGSVVQCLFLVIIVSITVCSVQGQSSSDETLNDFFEAYSNWQSQRREAGQDQDNASFRLNWGHKEDDISYWVSNEKADFYTGFIRCKQLGMEPVSVMTSEQNTKLQHFLESSRRADDGYAGFYLFARKVGNEFYWLNTGKTLAFSKWYVNYPDNVGGNENCLTMLFSGSMGIGWNDVECNKAIRFVCQKRRSSVAFVFDSNDIF